LANVPSGEATTTETKTKVKKPKTQVYMPARGDIEKDVVSNEPNLELIDRIETAALAVARNARTKLFDELDGKLTKAELDLVFRSYAALYALKNGKPIDEGFRTRMIEFFTKGEYNDQTEKNIVTLVNSAPDYIGAMIMYPDTVTIIHDSYYYKLKEVVGD